MIGYRKDIDGLRAVAVIPVVLFHLQLYSVKGIPLSNGGYVGVDVFFVISGFLISSILFNDIDRGSYDIKNFYARRVRRILPVLICVYLAVILFMGLRTHGEETTEIRDALFSSLAFVSNNYFASKIDYFNAGGRNPILHTWSLSVEEQFYLLFPLILLVIKNYAAVARIIITCALMTISFAYSVYLVDTAPTEAYFSMLGRAWELLIGTMLVFMMPMEMPRRVAEAVGFAGLAAILASVLFYDKSTPFPGVAALAPCLGSAAIIFSGAHAQTWVGRALTLPPIRFTGLISYSIYLWHWPIIVFLDLNYQSSLKTRLMTLVLIYGFSALSWRIIEQVSRGFRPKVAAASVLKVGAGGLIATSIFLAIAYKSNQTVWPQTERTQSIAEFAKSYKTAEIMRSGECFLTVKSPDLRFFKNDPCLKLSSEKKNVLILGDSHAAQYWIAFADVYKDVNFMQATASGCLPVIDTKGDKFCMSLWDYVTRDFLPKNHLDAIVLVGRWWHSNTVPMALRAAEFLSGYADTVYVVGRNIEFDTAMPKIMVNAEYGRASLEEHLEHEANEVDATFLAANLPPRVVYLSYFNAMCRPECPRYASDGKPVLFDDNHLTRSAADDVVAAWSPLFKGFGSASIR